MEATQEQCHEIRFGADRKQKALLEFIGCHLTDNSTVYLMRFPRHGHYDLDGKADGIVRYSHGVLTSFADSGPAKNLSDFPSHWVWGFDDLGLPRRWEPMEAGGRY